MRIFVHLLVRDKKKFLLGHLFVLGLYVKSSNRAHSKWCRGVCALYATKRPKKEIIMANHSLRRQCNDPIRARS